MQKQRQDSETWSARFKRWGLLAAIFFVGVFLVAVAHEAPWPLLMKIVEEAGMALMIAAILGGTVDGLFKTELVRDAFLATFRYVARPELLDEVLRIIRYRLVCDSHRWLVKIEIIDDDAVRVTCETHRKIKNVGASAEPVRAYIHIDDWGFKCEKSKIHRCEIVIEGKGVIYGEEKLQTDGTLMYSTDHFPLNPKKYCTMISKWTEVRRHNDLVYVNFQCPTIDPEIEVQLPKGFKATRSFGAASTEIESTISDRETARGTYLPFHVMVVRWWPEKANDVIA